jgi:hypothetical protein
MIAVTGGARQRKLRQDMEGAGSGLVFGRQEVQPAKRDRQKGLRFFQKRTLLDR